MIEMFYAEKTDINLCKNVLLAVICVAIAPDKQQAVGCEQYNNGRNRMAMIAAKRENADCKVAYSDALHYGPDAKMTEIKSIPADSHVEPVDKQANKKQ